MSTDSPSPQELQALLAQLQANNAGTRKAVMLFSIAAIVILSVFGIALYSSASSNLSTDKLKVVLNERAEFYAPEIRAKAQEAMTLAMPAYQQEISEKAKTLVPELQKDLRARMDAMPKTIEKKLMVQMEQMNARVETNAKKAVQARFPKIDEAQIQRLANRAGDQVLASGNTMRDRLETRLAVQLDQFHQVLIKFNVPATAYTSGDQLLLNFVENVALLVAHLSRNPDQIPDFKAVAESLGAEAAVKGGAQ